MRRRTERRMLAAAVAACLVGATAAGAQPLASRVAAARDGAVVFHFAAREGVCGDGEGMVRLGHTMSMGDFRRGPRDEDCVAGPVQVRVSLRDGAVERVQSWVGRPRPRDGRDLGEVPAAEAARWLLDLAARGRPRAAEQAMVAAMLAAGDPDWRALLAVARDADRPREVRSSAGFWLSRLAAAAALGHPGDLAADEGGERGDEEELKLHAVFVLSQRSRDEAVPALVEIARGNADPRVRSRALFWLGQSGDPRALALFERVLGAAGR